MPDEEDGEDDDIVCFDALTLAEQFRFGLGLFGGGAHCIAVTDTEVFVGTPCRIRVFSPSGEHRRDISGGFGLPRQLLHHNGRIYVLEARPGEGHHVSADCQGRRVIVFATTGEVLQYYHPPIVFTEHNQRICDMFLFHGQLFLLYSDTWRPDGALAESPMLLHSVKGI